jgi:hypothetical protein
MLSTSFSKTVGNKRYTLAQWQQNPPDGKTSLSTTFASTKCGKCCKFDSSIVLCTRSQNVDIFCQGCWDEADWQCPGCNTIPDDSEVVGCKQCGQWVHNNCSVFLDVTDGYVCTGCQSSDTLLLKAQLYTKEVELNSLATERKKMLTKLQTTTLKLELFKDILATRFKRKVVDLTVDDTADVPINSEAKRQRTDAGGPSAAQNSSLSSSSKTKRRYATSPPNVRDTFKSWYEAKCVRGGTCVNNGCIKAKLAFESYKDWCGENDIPENTKSRIGKYEWTDMMNVKGHPYCKHGKRNNHMKYLRFKSHEVPSL